MKNLLLLLSLLFIGGCSTVQIIYTEPTTSDIKEDEHGVYVYETDSIKIAYIFWENKGVMAFTIENKMDLPIYLDWRRSSFINGHAKYDYYTGVEKTNTKGTAATIWGGAFDWSAWYPASATYLESESITYKEQPLSFIPPHSGTVKASYYILNDDFINMKTSTTRNLVNSDIKAKVLETDKEHSKLFFRNYLCYTTKEDGDPVYVNNEFYVKKVIEVAPRHLQVLKKPTRFYVQVFE